VIVEIWQTIGMSQKDFSNRRIATQVRKHHDSPMQRLRRKVAADNHSPSLKFR